MARQARIPQIDWKPAGPAREGLIDDMVEKGAVGGSGECAPEIEEVLRVRLVGPFHRLSGGWPIGRGTQSLW